MIEWDSSIFMDGESFGCSSCDGVCFGLPVARESYTRRGRTNVVYFISGEDRAYGSENQLIDECERRAAGEFGDDRFEIAALKHEVRALRASLMRHGISPDDARLCLTEGGAK